MAWLVGQPVPGILADLTPLGAATAGGDAVDLTKARRLAENAGVSFIGVQKGGDFQIPGSLARKWLQEPNPHGKPNRDVLRPLVNGVELTRGMADRFALWILDTADASFDQRWLDWQHEIGLRHHRTKKNRTDGANSVPQVDFRHIPALTIPITTTLKPFLAKKGAAAEEVEKMHAAWVKAVLLQSILWSQPYVRDGQF